MNKAELIETIREINRTADPDFLAKFSEEQLAVYLERLENLEWKISCRVDE